MIKLDNTKKFFEEIKTMGFLKRLFYWGKIIPLLTESYSEISKIEDISSDLKVAEEKINALTKENRSFEIKNNVLTSEKDKQIEEIKALSNKVSGFEQIENKRIEEHKSAIEKLQKTTEDFDKRRQKLEDEQVEKEKQRFEDMKKTWKNHEDLVEQSMKQICNKYAIEYIDKEKLPFKGKPDNTIKIANEYIIFDAKSPSNDDLSNFPKYVKSQAESLKKYAKNDDVKKDIFLVVPTNTIDLLDMTYHDLSDYRVYVITYDSLEPIILTLRKIEDYEFAEKLSPEDRETICKIIGHFAHHTKRRLQIDTFLGEKSIELLKKCDYLPEEILDEVKNHELKSKINVPLDKRFKKSEIKKLESDTKKMSKELEIQHINTKVDSKKIDDIELYDQE